MTKSNKKRKRKRKFTHNFGEIAILLLGIANPREGCRWWSRAWRRRQRRDLRRYDEMEDSF